ncbi:hypothetical protein CPB83DRAFT_833882 [Crepidotus variabilis]|uniref:Uncharacterized protein n=1 Tax=Crepidotus variabilis TaxID=179855 RepID=A0A9P6EJH7_9AGAR|nr:hypothetical protein CPB83DRAFT_833882 [Crepidotus variabilis]
MANTYLATKWKRPFKILFILTNVMLGVFERQRSGHTWCYGPGKKLCQFDWPAVQYGNLQALIFGEATLRRGRVDADEQLLKNDQLVLDGCANSIWVLFYTMHPSGRVGVLDPAHHKSRLSDKTKGNRTPAPGKLQGSEPIQVTSEQKLGLKYTGEDILGQPMQEEIGQYNNIAEPDAEESKDVVITSADNASLVLYLVKYISKE